LQGSICVKALSVQSELKTRKEDSHRKNRYALS